MLFLTSDSTSVLDLMGLDVQKYWRQFATVNELYEYAISTRFFRKDDYVREGLKSNDRKRMGKRPLYQQFVDDWLPQRMGIEKQREVVELTRESVLEEVLDGYGKRGEYEETLRIWRNERAELQAKQQNKEQRRAGAIAEAEYAEAWIQESRIAEI